MSNGFYTQWMRAVDDKQRLDDEIMRHQIQLDIEHQEKVFTRIIIFEKHKPELSSYQWTSINILGTINE